MMQSIHPDTSIGTVSLTVSNMEQSLDFYQNRLGFQVHHREKARVNLGVGGQDLLQLVEEPNATQAQRTTGLYHFAVLLPTRAYLAKFLHQMAATQFPLQGFADHWVSEAIYFSDPDGNGIEVYRDRPREEWKRVDGQIQIGTKPLNIDNLLAELENQSEGWTGFPKNTRIGHIHLHVAHLQEAVVFYRDVLGFDLISYYGQGAAFLSAGGYHHHIGVNTWAGVGAPQPPKGSVGLRWYQIRVPSEEALNQLVGGFRKAGLNIENRGEGILLRDPSHNGILLASN